MSATLEHRFAVINGLRLHYVTAGQGDPVLLIHGFPQTWYEWHNVIPALAKRFTVIAPDYRGAGDSGRPQGGFDKHTMMEDLRGLIHSLGFKRIRLVGHDVGLMIAYRYAAVHPDEVEKLAMMDAPVPGTDAWTQVRTNPRAWHVNFHNARDVPEMLVAGREREYLSYFYSVRLVNPTAMPQSEMDVYIRSYASPGGMRCGFEVYRAMLQDAEDNLPYLKKKLDMPVLMLAGAESVSAPVLEKMVPLIAANSKFQMIADAGHWLCEENPQAVEKALTEFL
jgi:pimeloyl-ACP methyl ester carboxylesterase